jgi:hypothetical protein
MRFFPLLMLLFQRFLSRCRALSTTVTAPLSPCHPDDPDRRRNIAAPACNYFAHQQLVGLADPGAAFVL